MLEIPRVTIPGRNGARGEGAALGLLLAAFLLLYVSSSFGLVSSNDGSHFAATRALAEQGTLQVDRELAFALNDTSIHDGRRYSSKPPGTALLALPFYGLSLLFPDSLAADADPREETWYAVLARLALRLGHPISLGALRAAYTETRAAQAAVTLLAAFAGVLALWATYRSARGLGASPWASGATLVALGMGTLIWRYSTALFAHVLGAALLAVQLEWLLSGQALRTRRGAFGWGLLLGGSVVVEYQAVLALPPLLLGWGFEARKAAPLRDTMGRLAFVALGLGIPAAGLAWYQHECFGSAFRSASAATEQVEFWYTRSLGTMFGGSFLDGARTMLFSSEAGGLFRVSPVLLLAVGGWLCWPRERRPMLAVAVGVVVLHCAVMFKVVAPDGGGTADHRYLVRILPVLMLPLALALDRGAWLARSLPRGRTTALALGGMVALGLTVTSVLRSYAAVAGFLKHRILLPDTANLRGGGLPALAGQAAAAFPSWNHAPLLLLALTLFAVAVGVVAWSARGRGFGE